MLNFQAWGVLAQYNSRLCSTTVENCERKALEGGRKGGRRRLTFKMWLDLGCYSRSMPAPVIPSPITQQGHLCENHPYQFLVWHIGQRGHIWYCQETRTRRHSWQRIQRDLFRMPLSSLENLTNNGTPSAKGSV